MSSSKDVLPGLPQFGSAAPTPPDESEDFLPELWTCLPVLIERYGLLSERLFGIVQFRRSFAAEALSTCVGIHSEADRPLSAKSSRSLFATEETLGDTAPFARVG
jgi:hypothetical protein